MERTHTFTTEGCDHYIYVWVDKADNITESDESNNVVSLQVCVGVECEVDAYEGDSGDDELSAAGWLNENVAQARSFCHVTDKQLADEDWVKFTAFAGVTYTLASSNPAEHAEPRITLYGVGGSTELARPDPAMSYHISAAGVYYAKIVTYRRNRWNQQNRFTNG